ncbi:MAG TPA: hypothetical protein VFQ40_05825 [Actinomycetota bacterium]|nr:hypothetical protein [Actinomycetota bacterium]
MEPEGTHRGGLGAELDRIEAAVDAGDADLRRLGFWRLVGLIKRDDEAVERHADQVGRIDAKAFARAPLVRLPVWVGLVLMVLAVAAGAGAVTVALDAGGPTTSGVALVAAAGLWAAGLHSLTHYVVGRAVGIGFTHLFGKLPPPPLPGLKTDYASYLRTSPVARAWMHASGAVATKAAPFLALAFAPAAGAPAWAIAVLVGLGLFQLATDVLFSTKASDWKKVRRELSVARAWRAP